MGGCCSPHSGRGMEASGARGLGGGQGRKDRFKRLAATEGGSPGRPTAALLPSPAPTRSEGRGFPERVAHWPRRFGRRRAGGRGQQLRKCCSGKGGVEREGQRPHVIVFSSGKGRPVVVAAPSLVGMGRIPSSLPLENGYHSRGRRKNDGEPQSSPSGKEITGHAIWYTLSLFGSV